jgi:hypothetical protein
MGTSFSLTAVTGHLRSGRVTYKIQNFDVVWTRLLGKTCERKLEENITSTFCNYSIRNLVITAIRWIETPN